MQRTHLPDHMQQILSRIKYATIATVCEDGSPWNSPVFAVFDDDLKMYWVSWAQNQHSRNIARDPRVFVVVYDSQIPEGEGLGLYLSMQARVLTDLREIVHAQKIYGSDFFKHGPEHVKFSEDCPQNIYEATPVQAWYNDDDLDNGHFIDVRREITL